MHFFSGSHVNDVFDLRLGWKDRAVRLFWSVWKGAPAPPALSSVLVLFRESLTHPAAWRHAHAPRAGSVLSALYFLVLWPITIAIIAPIWGGKDMAHTWVPEAIKLVFGQSVRSVSTFFSRRLSISNRDRGERRCSL